MKILLGRMSALIYLLFCFSLPVAAEVEASYQLGAASSGSEKSNKQTPSSVGEYRLDSGDQIKIHILGESDLDLEVKLDASGDIRYPFLGKIHVTGMTVPELGSKISSELANGYLIDPQVRVSVEHFRSFYVNGEVSKPGAYPYEPGLTVRKAISLAGGFTVEADKEKVYLISATDETREEYKITLQSMMGPGDIVTVKKSFFYVNGEVSKPGKYTYQLDMTIRMAISMAGGMKQRADKDDVIVIHEGESKENEHAAKLDDKLKPGDVVTVEESFF